MPPDFFPQGCRWRTLGSLPATGMSTNRTVAKQTWEAPGVRNEYWDPAAQAWTGEQPPGCRLRTLPPGQWLAGGGGQPGAAGQQGARVSGQQVRQRDWPWDGPVSGVQCEVAYCMYTNLWYSGGLFYFLAEERDNVGKGWQMSRSRQVAGGVLVWAVQSVSPGGVYDSCTDASGRQSLWQTGASLFSHAVACLSHTALHSPPTRPPAHPPTARCLLLQNHQRPHRAQCLALG